MRIIQTTKATSRRRRIGRRAQKPKCRWRILLHRAGYKSPGYKRPEPVTSVRPPVCSRSCKIRKPTELAGFLVFFRGRREARLGRHEVADLNDRCDGHRRHAFIAELRTPRASRSARGRPFLPSFFALLKSSARMQSRVCLRESGSERTRDARTFRATQCKATYLQITSEYRVLTDEISLFSRRDIYFYFNRHNINFFTTSLL